MKLCRNCKDAVKGCVDKEHHYCWNEFSRHYYMNRPVPVMTKYNMACSLYKRKWWRFWE